MSVIQAAQRAEERRQQALFRHERALALASEAEARGDHQRASRLRREARLHEQAAAFQEAAIARLLTDIPRGKLSDELQDALHSAAEAARSDKHRSA